jgi:hypothetical protein
MNSKLQQGTLDASALPIEPFGDQIIVTITGRRSPVFTQIEIITVNPDTGLPGRFVKQIRRFSLLGHRGAPFKKGGSKSGSNQFYAALPSLAGSHKL